MQYHAKAALTVIQRAEVQRLHQSGISQSELARRFHVDRRTIRRWVERTELTDRSSAPHRHGGRVVTDDYRQAVLDHRQVNPSHGPKRIAQQLRERFPSANVATVWRVLRAAGLSKRTPKKTQASPVTGRSTPGAARHSRVAGHSRRQEA